MSPGISGKSQILFAAVYTTRYLDLLSNFISLYNTLMKVRSVRRRASLDSSSQVVFIAASYATLYLMYIKFKATYDRNQDTFRVEFLLLPVTILALILNHEFTVFEVRVL